MPDWRDQLLKRFSFPGFERAGRNPIGWPGYEPRAAVRHAMAELDGAKFIACVWDFDVYGGSFSELDATTFAEAVDHAVRYREPLVSLVRSGGVRLQEGVAALTGLARVQLALADLRAAGVPHVAVADHPTTGGVLVSVVTRADIRAAVAGATVGFAGPRVSEAMTGTPLPAGSHTGESAYQFGLVDALLARDEVRGWLTRTLAALAASTATTAPTTEVAFPPTPGVGGAAQVTAVRAAARPPGREVLAALVPDGTALRAEGGDETVGAVIGHLADGAAVVGVAVAAENGGRPAPAGYRLLARAAALADSLGRPLVSLVDTPGADAGAGAERDGIATAIGDALDAMLGCRAPTLALVIGEGGSGGALAATVADHVAVAPSAYFAALAPEGAAVALRMSPEHAADLLRLTPPDLLTIGFADTAVPDPGAAGFATAVRDLVARLSAEDPANRQAARRRRWSSPLRGLPG